MTHQERIDYLISTSETITAQLKELIALRKQLKALGLAPAEPAVPENLVSLVPEDGSRLALEGA